MNEKRTKVALYAKETVGKIRFEQMNDTIKELDRLLKEAEKTDYENHMKQEEGRERERTLRSRYEDAQKTVCDLHEKCRSLEQELQRTQEELQSTKHLVTVLTDGRVEYYNTQHLSQLDRAAEAIIEERQIPFSTVVRYGRTCISTEKVETLKDLLMFVCGQSLSADEEESIDSMMAKCQQRQLGINVANAQIGINNQGNIENKALFQKPVGAVIMSGSDININGQKSTKSNE